MNTTEGYKAVCYRCSYEAEDSREQRCPVCHFPCILEHERTPPGGRKLELILKRSSVREDTAPPLPGVDGEKRKAQLLAEARKQRQTERRARARAITEQRTGGTALPETAARSVSRIGFALLCVSAVAAGAVAAVIHHVV